MAYKVIFAPAAIARLEDIVRYIPGTAYRKRKNVRRLRCDPYFIYYRVKSKERAVELMEFWHVARRDPEL